MLAEPNAVGVQECRYRCKDGSYKWIEFKAANLLHDPEIQGILGNYHDITERKKAEAEAQHEQVLSNTIIDSIPGTFYLLDENGSYVRWNTYQREVILGKTEEQVAGMSAIGTIHPEDRALIQTRIANVLRDGKEEMVEGRVLLHGGPAFIWMLMTGRRMMIAGRPFLVGTGIDITESKKSERKLKLFRELIGHSTDAIFVIDPPTGRFLDVSEGAESALGYSREELLNMGVLDIETGISDAKVRAKRVEALKLISNITTEGAHKRKDGTTFPVEVSSKYLNSDDGDYIVAIARNMTERKRAEGLSRQQERLSALAQMVGGVAHDFNNVLMPIIGFSDMLLSDPKILDDRKELIHMLEIIQSASTDARHIVQRMRQIYKEEAGEYTSLDLAKVVESVISMTMPKWKEEMNAKGACIEMVTKFKSAPRINGNASELREVFTNLIFNALDAMPEGGTITLLVEATRDKSVVVSVSDTGCGMDETMCRRCIEPFFSTKGVQGTGLGLSMVDGIVKRHGGSVTIDSKLGVGTTVMMRFLLPVDTSVVEDMPKKKAKALSPLSVLIIDDEERSRNLLVTLLAADSHVTQIAKDGPEGVKIASEQEFDLIITDRAMPLMSGDDVARKISKIRPGTPIIMLTGFGDIMKDKSELPQGVCRVIAKPVTRNDLRHVMGKVMRGAPEAR